VASPWLQAQPDAEYGEPISTTGPESFSLRDESEPARRVTRLQAEPQQGPVEYKLHLLLRPRRKFRSISTGEHISGSRHSNFGLQQQSRSVSESMLDSAPNLSTATPTAYTQQTRQHRLQQLTTQLLWRLQQSSPHHTSSATNIILPSLPEALPELHAPPQPAKLLHGLEESEGALYEIGVSDDGTLVGLAEDELQESLNNLRAMAACLGCTVEVLRKETVGDCEWIEESVVGRKERRIRRTGKLVVAEALVKPCLQATNVSASEKDVAHETAGVLADALTTGPGTEATEQLRITMTGPTMSGKSSLLGTLTTSTLDNGRGKSRLSMLKHRHEITSGITSSVTQELLGYREKGEGAVEVVNYASENTASWIDMHVAASGNRLVLISDSAGHPRYRRTTVRGLIGWDPHWTLLCVPADDSEDMYGKIGSTSGSQQTLGSSVSEIDLAGAQLDLCLKLGLPLVIVITKIDLVSRTVIKQTLAKVLDTLKVAGRKPAILPINSAVDAESELQHISKAQIDKAYDNCLPLLNDPAQCVPIVLTSAVSGQGITLLHALLHELPIPTPSAEMDGSSTGLYHIEDIYTKPAELDGIIVSGRLRCGTISTGDRMVLGPFSGQEHLEDSEDSDERPVRRTSAHMPTSRSFPGALRDSHLMPPYFNLPGQEWRTVKVTSIRNLRLPVHSLQADQIGTIAIVPDHADKKTASSAPLARVRKGMVLSRVQPLAARTFVAEFKREDLEALAVGNHVVVYIASVRASAKVVSARAPDSPDVTRRDDSKRQSAEHDPFDFEDVAETLEMRSEKVAGVVTAPNLLVTFRFDSAKEFVLVGDQVFVMPGGGASLYGGHERGQKGVAGLEGFVGNIKEIHA
jgi:GTPase